MRLYVGLYLAVWALLSFASGIALRHVRCADLTAPDGTIYAALSAGPHMPIPAIQSCHASGAPLFVVLALCYALLTWLWFRLTAASLPLRVTAGIALAVYAVALFFPYVSTTDAYAYALYAYEAGMLHLSPYAAHALPSSGPGALLNALFPTPASDVRVLNYGPSFAVAYAIVGALFGRSAASLVYGERLLSALCIAATGAFLAAASPPEQRRSILTAVLLSPLFLIEGVAFAHADVLMLAFLACAYYFFKRGSFAVMGAAIGAATGARSVALLAAIAGFSYLLKTNRRAAPAFAGGVAVSLLALAALSAGAFHSVSFGGGAALDPFGSPALILANLAGGISFPHSVAAAGIQAAIGFALVGLAIVNRRYEFVPVAALAAVPALRPWYCQWAVPVRCLPVSRDALGISAIVVSMAILGEASLLIDGSFAIAGTIVLTQWTIPIAWLALRRRS